MTCYSNKEKKEDNPKCLWYAFCKDEDVLKGYCPEDVGNPVTPEGDMDEGEDKDKLGCTYFHVEIF